MADSLLTLSPAASHGVLRGSSALFGDLVTITWSKVPVIFGGIVPDSGLPDGSLFCSYLSADKVATEAPLHVYEKVAGNWVEVSYDELYSHAGRQSIVPSDIDTILPNGLLGVEELSGVWPAQGGFLCFKTIFASVRRTLRGQSSMVAKASVAYAESGVLAGSSSMVATPASAFAVPPSKRLYSSWVEGYLPAFEGSGGVTQSGAAYDLTTGLTAEGGDSRIGGSSYGIAYMDYLTGYGTVISDGVLASNDEEAYVEHMFSQGSDREIITMAGYISPIFSAAGEDTSNTTIHGAIVFPTLRAQGGGITDFGIPPRPVVPPNDNFRINNLSVHVTVPWPLSSNISGAAFPHEEAGKVLTPVGAFDEYTYGANAAFTLYITVTTADMDNIIRVLDQDWNLVVESDNTDDSRSVHTLAAPLLNGGIYHIQVGGVAASSLGKAYTIGFSDTAPALGGGGTDLGSTDYHTETGGFTAPIDFLWTPAPGANLLTANTNGSDFDTTLTLFDAADMNTPLAYDDDGGAGNGNSLLNNVPVVEGTNYVIRLKHYSDGSTGNYAFEMATNLA